MTLTLEIAPETEGHIIKKAERLGLSVQQYVRQVLEEASTVEPTFARPFPQERVERFLKWAESHDHDTPLLTDKEISREAIYGGRD